MAVTTVLFWVSLVLSVIGSNADGELAILHSPNSLGWLGSGLVRESMLKEIMSAALGLSVEENSNWSGLSIRDPFKSPESVLLVYIDSLPTFGNEIQIKGPKFPVRVDEYEPDTFYAMKRRIQQRFGDDANNLVSIQLSNLDELTSHYNVFGDVMVPKLPQQIYQHLNPETDEDYKFIMELSAMKGITDKVKAGAISPDNKVDFYHLRVSTLHALSDLYGPNSSKVKEAKKLLGEELERLTNAYVKAYDSSVLVAAVTTDVAHTRRIARSVEGQTRRSAKDSYPEDYAAIFNILLWFGVVFVFVLIAIVYALIDMDPGRDSIIYRMTSTRMKKDN